MIPLKIYLRCCGKEKYSGKNKIMGKIIYINESKLNLIKEVYEEEVTYYSFLVAIKEFLSELLKNPTSASLPLFFKEHDITRPELLRKLTKRGVINKKEDIDEPDGEHGVYKTSYSIPKKNFNTKIERLYLALFVNKRNKLIDETDAGGVMGGGGTISAGEGTANSAAGSGQYVGPLSMKIQRRKIGTK